ncbi:hypothetical protein J1N35_037536, partial [Gossypium stocksii]
MTKKRKARVVGLAKGKNGYQNKKNHTGVCPGRVSHTGQGKGMCQGCVTLCLRFRTTWVEDMSVCLGHVSHK